MVAPWLQSVVLHVNEHNFHSIIYILIFFFFCGTKCSWHLKIHTLAMLKKYIFVVLIRNVISKLTDIKYVTK